MLRPLPLRLLLLAIAFTVCPNKGRAETLTVAPQRCVIVVPASVPQNDQVAAWELQLHLQLITGEAIDLVPNEENVQPSDYPFRVGVMPADDRRPLASEEGQYVITPRGAWFYGDQDGYGDGARFAVYEFLESQLGVTWIEPGDRGIAFEPAGRLHLTVGRFGWKPKLVFRKIRQSIRRDSPHRPVGRPSTDPFLLSSEEHNRGVDAEVRWQKRMRMGGSRPGGGHAFSGWWEKYGQSHPEYFALNKFGKREPVALPQGEKRSREFVKICPSNPAVAEQIIADWLPREDHQKYISTGPNDGYNFCRCENCKAIDVRREGETFPGHLTDRYVHLSNLVAREARKHREDAQVTMYAYLTTLLPPRRLKLEPNIVVQIVPYVVPLKLSVNRELFAGWREAGATQLALRPNYHHKYMSGSLPLGIEKQMFDVFQHAYQNGAVSADYDMLMGNWAVGGITDYILAKAMAEPDEPFEHWEDRYCRAFGDAHEEVKRYFRFWRENVWNKRLLPDIEKINATGRYGFFLRGLMWSLDDEPYYQLEDFDRTDDLLQQAMSRELTDRQRARLRQLVLANEHARRVYLAASTFAQQRYQHTIDLNAFRLKHKDELHMSWVRLIGLEDRYNWTAVQTVENLKDFELPWLMTGMAWRFKMDPRDLGLREQWQTFAYEQTDDWQQLRTDNFWERAYDSETEPALKTKLSDYDGTAWYMTRLLAPDELKGRNIFLHFGGVGDSCDVYVNGKHAGSHTTETEENKTQSFTIRIDPLIDWTANHQTFCVRVDNERGLGGLFGRVWVVSQTPR